MRTINTVLGLMLKLKFHLPGLIDVGPAGVCNAGYTVCGQKDLFSYPAETHAARRCRRPRPQGRFLLRSQDCCRTYRQTPQWLPKRTFRHSAVLQQALERVCPIFDLHVLQRLHVGNGALKIREDHCQRVRNTGLKVFAHVLDLDSLRHRGADTAELHARNQRDSARGDIGRVDHKRRSRGLKDASRDTSEKSRPLYCAKSMTSCIRSWEK